MTFDTPIDHTGTHSQKWDTLEKVYGLKPDEGLAMWVADMDFRPPQVVQQALEKMLAHGMYGYFGDDRAYLDAICWWMQTRHGWEVAPEWIFTTHGLVNGLALCVHSFTKPGDSVIVMTPVYHAFARILKATGREVLECPLTVQDGKAQMDFATWEASLTGREKMLILCSPHNPGGRVWTVAELRAVADFCVKHDLILISDEIHHDLVYPGQKHTVMPNAAPEITDRLVMMTSTAKTFNLAGAKTGNVIIASPALRNAFAATMSAMGMEANAFGKHMVTAAYSSEGAAWVDDLMNYMDANRRVFDEGINRIPGLHSTQLEATYLAWVDFSGTGMTKAEFIDRVQNVAKIATNLGSSFGTGGESYLRFNLACPRAQIVEAVARMERAFADLQ